MDYTALLDLVRSSNETMEQINRQLEGLSDPAMLAASAQAAVAAAQAAPVGVQEQASAGSSFFQRQIEAMKAKSELHDVLRTKSTPQLHQLFGMALAHKGRGVPFETWAATSGQAAAIYDAFRQQTGSALAEGLDLNKALDSGGAAALIRTDLEPFLYELYVREFAAYERFVREPANGLTHTYNQITSFGAAQFMPELGTVTDDTSVYARKTTNVAIVATRRGLSLKSQYAVAAGGMSYNPMDLELQGGLRAIAYRMQKQIFSGQSTNSGGSASTEDGEYQPNGFDGLRTILNTVRAKDVNPLTGTAEDIKHKLDLVIAEITQSGGGRPSIMWAHPLDKITFDQQQDAKTRVSSPTEWVDIAVGARAASVNTLDGPVPFGVVRGDSVGAYTDGGGVARRDVYVLDESTISLPYLGSEGPTVLDIPIGISGQLTHLFIIFGMWGFAVKALPFSNKLRVRQS